MTALCLSCRRKTVLLGYIYVLLMAFSRCYLMAHYPSDVIAAMIIGGISAVIAFFIAKWIFILLEKHHEKRLFGFILDFDLPTLIKK